ncbi:MAG: hypothetical protein BMS9Abin11_0622 [Gammaproteobacteria bacterium]|nr:MAG: hypothetical protein BMS9Abin11_0622 [Gammaproteobacteria bacterium]
MVIYIRFSIVVIPCALYQCGESPNEASADNYVPTSYGPDDRKTIGPPLATERLKADNSSVLTMVCFGKSDTIHSLHKS